MFKTIVSLFSSLIALGSLFTISAQSGFVDDFNHGLASNWTIDGARGWYALDGRLYPASNSNASGFIINKFACKTDGELQVTFDADEWNGYNGGIVFRWTAPNKFYYIAVRPGNQYDNSIFFCKNNLDVWSGQQVAHNVMFGRTGTIKVVLEGSTFKVFYNGALVGTATDSENSNGLVGCAYSNQWNSYFSFDDFSWNDHSGTGYVPPSSTPVETGDLSVFMKDDGIDEENIMKPCFYVINNSDKVINSFSLFFFLKKDHLKKLVLDDYKTPDCDAYLEDLGDDDYILTFEYRNAKLKPGAVTPDLSGSEVGLHYSDWSPLEKQSFFSYEPSRDFTPAAKVPVIAAGRVVGGTTPVFKTHPQKFITLSKLHCTETEDWGGADECRLQVYVDGQYYNTYYRGLNNGQDYNLNEKIPFNTSVDVHLYDHDAGWGDDDDNLGSVTALTDNGDHSGSFRNDGANYTLYYTVAVETLTVSLVKTEATNQITVKKLHCSTTEDDAGADESRLKLTLDNVLVAELSRDLNDGDDFIINSTYNFTNGGFFNLYDNDAGSWYDSHDFLGKVTINTDVGDHEGRFTRDGADYTVYYTITKTVVQTTDLGTFMLEKFRNSTATGMWDNVIKGTLLTEIENTLADPQIIDQNGYGFCGPAAIMYVLAKRYPMRFVNVCRTIFENGELNGRTRKYTIDSDEDVYSMTPKHRHLDFMTCAFLRDEANIFLDVDNDVGFSHLTTPWEMEEWIHDILGFTDTDTTTSFVWGEVDALEDGVNAANEGGVAFFLVDAEEYQDRDGNWFGLNHWIAYTGDYKYEKTNNDGVFDDDYRISFKFYQWGNENDHIELGEGNFEDFMNGAVYAK